MYEALEGAASLRVEQGSGPLTDPKGAAMNYSVLTKQHFSITPREHQEAYQQGLTCYGYIEIALMIQDIHDLEPVFKQTLWNAQNIASLYEHDRTSERINAHTWACMPIPAQIQRIRDLLQEPIPVFHLGDPQAGEDRWPLEVWQSQLTTACHLLRLLRQAVEEYHLDANLQAPKDYWRAWQAEVERRPESWDSDFRSCNIRRDLHEKIGEMYPLYVQASLDDQHALAAGYGIIIHVLDSKRSRQAVRKGLQRALDDYPSLDADIRTVIAAFLEEQQLWFDAKPQRPARNNSTGKRRNKPFFRID
jgi:hypothetical protein